VIYAHHARSPLFQSVVMIMISTISTIGMELSNLPPII
jgi:hypothetical protein